MKTKFRNRYFFIADIIFLALTPILALCLRVSFPWDRNYLPAVLVYTALVLFIRVPVFFFFGLYRRYWPYASIDALVDILKAVTLASILVVALFFALGTHSLPRSLPFIDSLITLMVIGGTRFSLRLFIYQQTQMGKKSQARRVFIIGAGDAGQMVAREIHTSRHIALNLVGFVDDDPQKIGTTIIQYPVFGPLKNIPALVAEYHVQNIIIAMPTAPGKIIRRVVAACEKTGIIPQILPGMFELISGQVGISRLREVRIEDLLRRDSVNIDPCQVVGLIQGKTVLVSGGGGSIGSELCAQIAQSNPARLVILGHGENSLFGLHARFKELGLQDCNLDLIVADVRDRDRLQAVFTRFRPQVIFHAAAHKHVPLMEDNLEDAVTNNIIGTWNLVQMSIQHEVDRFVLISTDKAVQPVNIMGMTKHVAERIVRLAADQTGRPYVSVRFGNVLGSRGSVIPIFQRQIASGGPVTITHPEMERYFMTIHEAVQLVLQAAALGQNGEVFVLDMGEPVKITDLARDMIELSGYQVGEEIQIEYTGLRPGERLSEALFSQDENCSRTQHEKIFVARNGIAPSLDAFTREIQSLEQLAKAGQTAELRQKLESLTASPELEPHRT